MQALKILCGFLHLFPSGEYQHGTVLFVTTQAKKQPKLDWVYKSDLQNNSLLLVTRMKMPRRPHLMPPLIDLETSRVTYLLWIEIETRSVRFYIVCNGQGHCNKQKP